MGFYYYSFKWEDALKLDEIAKGQSLLLISCRDNKIQQTCNDMHMPQQ